MYLFDFSFVCANKLINRYVVKACGNKPEYTTTTANPTTETQAVIFRPGL